MDEPQLHLLQEAQLFVSGLLQSKLSKNIKFHTFQHTMEVLKSCEVLAEHQQLAEEDKLALLLAAWFHDTGYINKKTKDHEKVSEELAINFLSTHGASPELTNKVINCIKATRIPQNPKNNIEEIICDADLFHLGTESFKEKNRLLLEELIENENASISKKEWRDINIDFLESHHYFTTYGKEILQPIKDQNLTALREKKQQKMKQPEKQINEKKERELEDLLVEQPGNDLKTKKTSDSQAERGINTVFRIVAQNQNNLSQMADSKANIMISVNAIVLSIVISNLFNKLEANRYLQLPVAMLVIVCVLAIVFSILATRPNVTIGKFTQEDIRQKKTNLLFFGNFYKMSLPDYDWAMLEMLNDKNYLYSSIVKDNYFLGVVLAKKYRYLRIAYNIFMYGLIITMIAFVIAFIFPATGQMEEYIKG